jgi:hypothetical protein
MNKKQEYLRARIEKAKALKFNEAVGVRGLYGCLGSRGDHYQVRLSSSNTTSQFGNRSLDHGMFTGKCNQYAGVGIEESCKGNTRTPCYHVLGAIIASLNKVNKSATFFDNIFDAINYRNFGGKLVMIKSSQCSDKVLWAVVKDVEKKIDASKVQSDINLMRGPIEEGID